MVERVASSAASRSAVAVRSARLLSSTSARTARGVRAIVVVASPVDQLCPPGRRVVALWEVDGMPHPPLVLPTSPTPPLAIPETCRPARAGFSTLDESQRCGV